MFIHDLEFINSCDRRIDGGAAASAKITTSATDSIVFANAEAEADGDYNRSYTVTGATLISRGPSRSSKGYTAGYSVGYALASGLDRYGSYITAKDRSRSVL